MGYQTRFRAYIDRERPQSLHTAFPNLPNKTDVIVSRTNVKGVFMKRDEIDIILHGNNIIVQYETYIKSLLQYWPVQVPLIVYESYGLKNSYVKFIDTTKVTVRRLVTNEHRAIAGDPPRPHRGGILQYQHSCPMGRRTGFRLHSS